MIKYGIFNISDDLTLISRADSLLLQHSSGDQTEIAVSTEDTVFATNNQIDTINERGMSELVEFTNAADIIFAVESVGYEVHTKESA